MRPRVPIGTLLAACAVLIGIGSGGGLVGGAPNGTPVVVDGSFSTGWDSTAVLDASGFPVISYYDEDAGVMVVRCNDVNCTGGDDIPFPIIVPSGFPSVESSLVLDASGFPVVVHSNETSLWLLHCNDENCSGGDDVSVAVSSGNVYGISVMLDSAGFPVILFGARNGGLSLLHCNDPNCVDGDDLPIGIGGFFPASIKLDSAGLPVVVYTGVTPIDSDQHMRLLRCNDSACAGGDDTSVRLGPLGEYKPSLELDSANNPVIGFTYSDNTGDPDLRLLRCNDPVCGGSDDVAVVLDALALNVSMKLDASGLPVIAYTDYDTLRLVRCNDPGCAGDDDVPRILDRASGDLSIVLDAVGFPVISYRSTGSGLKLLHCLDLQCAEVPAIAAPVRVDGLEPARRLRIDD